MSTAKKSNAFLRVAIIAFAAMMVGPVAQAAETPPPPAPTDAAIADAIDHFVDAKLSAVGVSAAPPADDFQWLRRVTLDLAGRIPTAAEVQAFAADQDQDKRVKAVDRLLSSPAFGRQQVDHFDYLLMAGTGGNLRGYLAQAFQENRSWDRVFRELMLGRDDDPEQKGAIQFISRRAKDLDKLTNDVSVLFFGVNVSCAQCHDHPLVDDWKQEHFYGMKSFFARTFDHGDLVAERDYGNLSYKTKAGENRDASLMFLDGQKVNEPTAMEPTEEQKKEEKKRLEDLKKDKKPAPAPAFSRRAALVETALKQGGTGFFARAIVNQLWARFYGRGLVSPVDQMHSANPASHPELLDWLAQDFTRNGYDVRRLTRGMVLSRTYARSSHWSSNERPDPALFAVAILRPLTPQQYAMTLRVASTSPDQFPATLAPAELEKRIEGLEGSARGLASVFEHPGSDFQVGIDEALLMSNGERIDRELLRAGNDSLVGKLAAMADADEALDVAGWNVFNRPLAEDEKQVLRTFVLKRNDRPADAYRQLVWALLTSGEGRFNH